VIPTCAPWDGPAVALFLTERPATRGYPAAPYSSITVYRGLTDVLGRRFEVGPATSNLGFAQDCPKIDACSPARAATVTFGGLNSDSTIAVTYRLELHSGRVLGGQIRPRLYPPAGFCG
jgi:hypothetical protein